MDELPGSAIYEEERLKTYKFWPFKKGSCCPEKMAEAGFYAIGSKSEPDLAKCYVCLKELDGWEKDDDPWSEHRKHAPKCPFITLNKKPNELTVKDILTLEAERVKRFCVLHHERKRKLLLEVQEAIQEQQRKLTNAGKENRKRKTSRASSKKSIRKD